MAPGEIKSAETPDVNTVIAQRNAAWEELREIRKAINANPEESTADEIRSFVAKAERNEKSLSDALAMLHALGVSEARIGTDVCRGIDVLATRYRKDINTALARHEVFKKPVEPARICGFCGALIDENNEPLITTTPMVYNPEKLPKGVCVYCAARETEPTQYVTREMALDAGDPSLEGQPI